MGTSEDVSLRDEGQVVWQFLRGFVDSLLVRFFDSLIVWGDR